MEQEIEVQDFQVVQGEPLRVWLCIELHMGNFDFVVFKNEVDACKWAEEVPGSRFIELVPVYDSFDEHKAFLESMRRQKDGNTVS